MSCHVPFQLTVVQPEINGITDQVPLESHGLVQSVSQGRKRKLEGEDPIARAAKKQFSMDTENADMAEVENTTGKEVGEGSAKRSEVKERGGKPTFSGRVPLMPTHLAEGGYQAEKKGVRGTGRKVQTTRKPKSKGHTTKPVSKGAVKIPGKKKVK